MTDTSIYILAYDKVTLLDNSLKVLYCGKTDNTGDNISNKNDYFVETTGIYWIWKNTNSKYVGNMQYRRFLSINPRYVENTLKDYDIILANPIIFPYSLRTQYMYKHNVNDIDTIKNIIKDKFPSYLDSYEKYIENGNVLFYSNSFITKRKIYNDLCNFCFSILFEFEKIFNLSNKEDRLRHAAEALKLYPEQKEVSHSGEDMVLYQSRFWGYLFERLLTLYIYHNKLNIYLCGNYIKLEDNMKI
jgi:hypothetical protein